MKKKLFEGKLNTFSEMGMEGGYLSIQNERYINLKKPNFGITDNVKVWDIKDTSKFGKTSNSEIYLDKSWLPLPDPIIKDPDFKKSSLNPYNAIGDIDCDQIIEKKYNLKIKYVNDILDEKFGINNWTFKSKGKTEIILKNKETILIGYSPVSVPVRPYELKEGSLTRVTVAWHDGTVEHKRRSDTLLTEQWSLEGLNMLKETDFLKVKNPLSGQIICEGQINLITLKVFSQTMKGHFENIKLKDENNDWEKYFTEQYVAELYR